MPPLSIEQDTKRLILAKKLDRENLDRYILAGGYQSSSSVNSLSLSSSASLTVHIKCQLKDRPSQKTLPLPQQNSSNGTMLSNTTTTTAIPTTAEVKTNVPKNSGANSILIPVHLIITDENDNWPNFIGSPYIIDLNETAQVGSLLQGNEIVAVDNDQQGPLSTIEYSIVSGSYWSDSFAFLNPLDSRSLVVKDNRLLDFESQSKLTLKVMACDQGDPPNWAITSLYINLLDQDDTNPIFGEDKYTGYIKDNRPGEVIDLMPKRMIARDGDKSINAPVIYSFHMKTNHSIHFDLDPDLGKLSLKKTLPEDTASSRQPFCLLVRATQVDNPHQWALTMINMRMSKPASPSNQLEHLFTMGEPQANLELSSTNLTILKFSQPNYTVEVSELASVGSIIFTVRAVYNLERLQNGIIYHLLDNELGYVNLDEHSGKLTLNRSLDYEMHRQFSVRVLATYEQYDELNQHGRSIGTYPNLFCDITRIIINVINHNEFTPEFSHEQYNFQLSVSDLIANFDSPKDSQSDQHSEVDMMSNDFKNKLSKRLGEFESSNESIDDLGYRALQLGQVFCADRDYGDRVALHLVGSKANLFYLTQDGRLYLPLVNISSLPPIISRRSGSNVASFWSQTQRTINNQFMPSRLFAPRRSDQSIQGTLDREYLNYLLGEFSNLGRLRLKVLAQDDGRPETRRSTSLIVVTIISIDNFILQRAPQPPIGTSDAATQLSNDTSYDTGRYEGTERDSSKFPGQFMMIPSTNGKSFVQIDSDIISNLLLHNNIQNTSRKILNDSNINNLRPSSESLDPAASNTVNHAISASESLSQSHVASNRFQPPSLLLVDDDGAKFVAMPAAIEVYNQQVQEAAGQLTRQKNQASLNDSNKRARQESSLWNLWKGQFGFGENNAQPIGPVYWINLSTAVMLHLVVLAVIITLVSRFRSSFRRSSTCQSGDSNLSDSSLWPRRFPKLSFMGVRESSRHPVVNILDRASSTSHSNVPFMVSNDSAANQRYAFLYQQNTSSTSQRSQLGGQTTENQSSYPNRHQPVSSGFVVSARSNGYNPDSASGNNYLDNYVDSKQQNLFDHLKLTINKVLDLRNNHKQPSIGQVTVKPLDSELETFDDHRNKSQLEISAGSNGGPYEAQSDKNVVEKKLADPAIKSISTFVGGGQKQHISSLQQGNNSNESSLGSAAVVSINVKAHKPSVNIDPSSGDKKPTSSNIGQNSSSSSSVVSLVSLSSTISNKISAAVGQTRDNPTTSDTSSLDSSTLFNGMVSRSSAQSDNVNQTHTTPSSVPPVPPPLPPPPSLVKADNSLSYQARRFTKDHQPIKSSPSYRPQTNTAQSKLVSSNAHVELPQNPIHVKLRQQALSEQICTSDSTGLADRPNPSGSLSIAKNQHNETMRPATSIGGRREARGQVYERVLPPTPPPMPTNITNGTSTKTVSPTTSVDRGYESFQSYTSSSQQQQRQRQTNQFSSLQEFDLINNQKCPSNSMYNPSPASVTSSSMIKSGTAQKHSGVKQKPIGFANQVEPSVQTYSPTKSLLRGLAYNQQVASPIIGDSRTMECNSGDGGFYYCCNNLESSQIGQSTTHDDYQQHQLSIGGLLSDYASHAYTQKPAIDGRHKESRMLQQQIINKQRAVVDSPRVPVQGRSATYQHVNSSTRTNDLNLINTRKDLHLTGCDISAQVNNIAYHTQNHHLKSQSARRHKRHDYHDQRLHHHHTTSNSFGYATSVGHGGSGGGANTKKQLTWSDQVELAS